MADATGPGGSGMLIGGLISAAILEQFEPVSSSLLATRQLLRRTDTKFLARRAIVDDLLGDVTATYGILKANEEPLPLYRTLYFDTESLRCFHDHRRGRRPRHKVRIRHYPDRQVSFLEVKTKRNELLTIKHRRRVPFSKDDLAAEDLAFVSEHCDVPAAELLPQVWTNFRRLTLVGFGTNERVTIDMNVQFVRHDAEVSMRDLAIVEIKQSPFSARTPIMRALRERSLRGVGASKYCTGTAVTRTDLRINRLLPTLRAVKKVSG